MSVKKKILSGDFIVIAEMNTPKGVDISELMTNSKRLKGRVDAVLIPDMDNGVMRMSCLAGASLMYQQGLETIISVYGRDRNRMALQGDMLAAHVLGVENLLVVRGEEMTNGDHRDAKPVDDLDEIGILNMIRSLNEGVDMAGFELSGIPEFNAGCTISPFTDEAEMDAEVELAAKKIKAGARYIVTPPVFDIKYYSGLVEKLKPLGVPIVATVFLLKSVGMARYISINDPSVRISEETIRRIRKASDRDAECIRIAAGTTSELKKIVQGVKIVAMGWEHRLPAILDNAGL